ncbi:MAG: cupin domain-containing protein [Burkholderiales bacterium]
MREIAPQSSRLHMRQFTLSLRTDRLAPRAEGRLPGCPRVLYLREGDAIVRAGARAAGLAANSAWHGGDAVTVIAGAGGATLLRWELGGKGETPAATGGPGVTSTLTLAHDVDLGDPGGYLMRCDRVDFPPGGIAYTHVHRGPGIRCLLAGGIRVEVDGRAHDIEPGGAWFEAGPEPVLATASKTAATAFVRVMILPRELRGKSSIRYVKPEDAGKPKLQTYRIFTDEFIELRQSA